MSKLARVAIAVNSVLLLGAVALVLWMRDTMSAPKLNDFGPVSAFKLTCAKGHSFDQGDFKGKVSVVAFIFTRCGGPCPIMTKNMSLLRDRFSNNLDVQWVSATVDPLYDNPDVMMRFAKRFDAESKSPDRWHFLTGDSHALRHAAIDVFHMADPDDLIVHSDQLALIDPRGHVRGYFKGVEDEEIQELATAIKSLL